MIDGGARFFGLDDGEVAVVRRLFGRLDAHRSYNERREALYEMREFAPMVSQLMPPQYGRLGMSLGWVAKGVDGLANRCNVKGIVDPGVDLDSVGLREWVDDNRAFSEFSSARTASLVHGPAFLVNTTGADGEPASLIHARSAIDATGDYNRRTRRMDNLLSVLASDAAGPSEFALYLDGVTITCVKDGAWRVVDRQEHSWGVPVEVLRYRPNPRRPFGTSRITPSSIYIQRAALRELARTEGHMDVFAWPEFWLLGADSEIFKDSSRFQTMMARIKAIPDSEDQEQTRADVKRFEAASPEPHLSWLNTLAKMMSREFNLPDSSFALSDYANPTSADSYVEGRDDLIADAEVAMDEWGIPLARSTRRGLAILNGDPGVFDALRGLRVKWRSPLHVSAAAEADAGAKKVAALPDWFRDTRVAMEMLGLSEEQIDSALAEKRLASGMATLAAAISAPSVGGSGGADG